MVKKLDTYIIRKFLGTFAYAIILFSVVSVVLDVAERLDNFLEKDAPVDAIIFDYYMGFVPHIIFLLFPIFVFISVIFFTSQLAARSEIVAILASGVSFYRILFVPYFISATVLVALQLVGNHYIVPQANESRLAFEEVYIRGGYVSNERNIHVQVAKGEFGYVESFNSKDTSGRKFTLEHFEDHKLTYRLKAQSIRWRNNKWKLVNYSIRTIDGLNETIQKGSRLDTVFNFTPDDFDRRTRSLISSTEAMITPELNQFIEDQTVKGSSNVPFYEVEKHRRTSSPFATYFLTIIGFAVASRKARGGMGWHILVGIAISSAYVLFLQFSKTFATNGDFSPLMSMWLANIVFGVLSIILLLRAPK